jgi:membrane protein implicated in regulation of membrane protease activity
LRGASWSARNVGEQSVKRSERLKVDSVDGLTLCIRGE